VSGYDEFALLPDQIAAHDGSAFALASYRDRCMPQAIGDVACE